MAALGLQFAKAVSGVANSIKASIAAASLDSRFTSPLSV
jgi:AMMECR1 domain-containing protein